MNFGKGRRIPGKMNKLEAKYSEHLEWRKSQGDVLWYAYEPIRFTLAQRTTYTPDFGVQLSDLSIEFHETKGYWLQAGRIKIKVAAEKFPFKFVGIKFIKNSWVEELF